MEIINNILQAREEKSNIVKQYINDYQIITLKANIVGKAAILAEGDAQKRQDIIYLEKLPLFNPDGTIMG